MTPAQSPEKTSNELSRCENRTPVINREKHLTPGQKTDALIKGTIDRALWNDDVLRAIDASEIDVHVRDSVVHLDGHIAGTASQMRIQNVIRGIPGLLGVHNNLTLDDKLTSEVAASLGALEHTYGCKFFTGASHGVVSLNGNVNQEDVKLLAEQRVSSHPNVRAVINNVQVLGAERGQNQPFLQPAIGQIVYFTDGISGVVRQVIINPDNRRVVAMTLWGQFTDLPQKLKSRPSSLAQPPEHLVVVSIDLIRYMTRVSGFLRVSSEARELYADFDPTRFSPPAENWKAPHPYCPDDVLFPAVERERKAEYQLLEQLPRSPFVVAWVEHPLSEELLANDSLGG